MHTLVYNLHTQQEGEKNEEELYMKLPQQFPSVRRRDLDDKSRENIIRVVDMRIPLHDKRVAALVADGVQGLSFSDNIDFITGPVEKLATFESHCRLVITESTLPYGT